MRMVSGCCVAVLGSPSRFSAVLRFATGSPVSLGTPTWVFVLWWLPPGLSSPLQRTHQVKRHRNLCPDFNLNYDFSYVYGKWTPNTPAIDFNIGRAFVAKSAKVPTETMPFKAKMLFSANNLTPFA